MLFLVGDIGPGDWPGVEGADKAFNFFGWPVPVDLGGFFGKFWII